MLYLNIIILLAFVIGCGDVFLRGILGISAKLKIPFFLLGATVVAVGTSSPDLFVGINAILKKNEDIIFGAVIGSAIVNILICTGIASLIFLIPCEKEDKSTTFGIYFHTLFILIFCIVILFTKGTMNLIFSIGLILSFLLFIFCILKSTSKDEVEEEIKHTNLYLDIAFFVAGLAGLLFFSDLLVTKIIEVSIEKQVNAKIISASIVSFSNSVPEIVTSILAACKKRTRIIVGNIVGSNVFILGGVVGVSSLIYNIINGSAPIISLNIVKFDLIVLLFASTILLLSFKIKSYLGKITGLIFIFIYLVYILLQFNII